MSNKEQSQKQKQGSSNKEDSPKAGNSTEESQQQANSNEISKSGSFQFITIEFKY